MYVYVCMYVRWNEYVHGTLGTHMCCVRIVECINYSRILVYMCLYMCSYKVKCVSPYNVHGMLGMWIFTWAYTWHAGIWMLAWSYAWHAGIWIFHMACWACECSHEHTHGISLEKPSQTYNQYTDTYAHTGRCLPQSLKQVRKSKGIYIICTHTYIHTYIQVVCPQCACPLVDLPRKYCIQKTCNECKMYCPQDPVMSW